MHLHCDDYIFKGGNNMSITEGIGSISYSHLTSGIQRSNNEGAVAKSGFDAVTSATNKSSSMGSNISFDTLSGGANSISITDLKAALEKLKSSAGQALSSASSSDTTSSTAPSVKAYGADAMTGATTSTKDQGGSESRLSLVLDLLNKESNVDQTYSAKQMDNLLTLLNGLNSNA